MVAGAMQATCGELGFGNLGSLIGWLHDFGKAQQAWQDWCADGFPQGKSIPHAPLGALWIWKKYFDEDNIHIVTTEIVALVIYGHHSGLPDVLNPDGLSFDNLLRERFSEYDENGILNECAESFFKEIISEFELDVLFNEAAREVKRYCDNLGESFRKLSSQRLSDNHKNSINICQNQIGLNLSLLLRFMFSALTDADWYSAGHSDCADCADAFQKTRYPWANYLKVAERNIVEMNHVALSTSKSDRESEIARTKQQISDLCRQYADRDYGVLTFNAKTGAGKTLSVMRLAIAACAEGKASKIFFIAPYLTVLEQNAKAIRDVLGDADGAIVLEHHSDVIKDSEEEFIEYLRLTERWDHPIVVTSLVQFLDAIYSSRRQAARRMHMLSDSVIIFDEVQAIPVSCTYLFNAAVNFLTEVCGARVILCSATQPYLEDVLECPIHLTSDHEIMDGKQFSQELFKRTCIHDCRKEDKYSSEEIANLIESLIPNNDSILVIMNTRAAAKCVYEEVLRRAPGECEIFYLSTDLCPAHRMKIINTIKQKLKESGNDEQPDGEPPDTCCRKSLICVSTQLVEAGVDFSFSCVLRSAAGIDSIVQAAGRCNRGGEFSSPRDVYIINSRDERFSYLKDIEESIDAMTSVLYKCDLHNNETEAELDLEDPGLLRKYYQQYRFKKKPEMRYRFKWQSKGMPEFLDAFDLLGYNEQARKNNQANNEMKYRNLLAQSFRTASENFHVIEGDTIGIVVPYGEGEKLIEDLTRTDPSLISPLTMRKTQRYSVNVYKYQLEKLMRVGALIDVRQLGIMVLDKKWYSETEGVDYEHEANPDDYIVS